MAIVGYTRKTKGRMFIVFVFFVVVICTLGYSLFYNLKQINSMKLEEKKLDSELLELIDQQESLEADIERLSDPFYVARYAREKYLYSKEGEIILRFSE